MQSTTSRKTGARGQTNPQDGAQDGLETAVLRIGGWRTQDSHLQYLVKAVIETRTLACILKLKMELKMALQNQLKRRDEDPTLHNKDLTNQPLSARLTHSP
ncbi:uncharacterized protein MEPE_04967 [Melanopsichium pennsylvanicum]|uniref:Uncharacterized protein n=1 Tax=Melanopsichium pennsylvanicum TaxID=63383 RepID=A0AAJ4XSG7_9BASI|nr:uncharacterized protein MEPE_04967 [Melanopsichium pennsylvanicum]